MPFNTIPSSSVPTGAVLAQVIIESGSGNWAPPRNMVGSFVDVTLVGGGGGGGNHTTADYGGGGGGGGETIFRSPMFIDGPLAYSIGAGGIGRVFGTIDEGTAGGSSTFGVLTAEGGSAGGHSLSVPNGDGGGVTGGAAASSEGDPGNDGGSATISQIIVKMGGASGGAYTNDVNDGGKGGDTIFATGGASTGTDDMGGGAASFGVGGAQGPNTTNVTPLYGGGGAGGQTTGSLDAQDGASGRLIIEYWTA